MIRHWDGSTGHAICNVLKQNWRQSGSENPIDDAALICRAVNRDALVEEMVQTMKNAVRDLESADDDGVFRYAPVDCVIDDLNQILAKLAQEETKS